MLTRIKKYWNDQLTETIRHAYKTKYYSKLFKELNISSRSDLSEIPITSSLDYRNNIFEFLATDLSKIKFISQTTGTTGEPKLIFFTQKDLDIMRTRAEVCWSWFNFNKEDRIAVLSSYTNPPLGQYYENAFASLRVMQYPAGVTRCLQSQMNNIAKLGISIIATHPSILTRLTKTYIQLNPKTNIKNIILSGEPFSKEYRTKMENIWNTKLINLYGSMEADIIAINCNKYLNKHLMYKDILVEIRTEDNKIKDQGTGEIILTVLNSDGFSLLRYATGDLGTLSFRECDCSLKWPILNIKGRVDDIIFIAGMNIFPSDIEHFLLSFPEISSNYLCYLKEKEGVTILKIIIETKIRKDKLKLKILKKAYKISPEVDLLLNEGSMVIKIDFVSPGYLAQTNRKTKRIIDLRKNN